ncbi:zinc ABC transporter substrate-binding protein [Ovoidimarina sediminis]|uniref:zinc ABC transporter substrate-binding protein n=1 Tax=Ovoidimarina sediminis TaxID=3079856 RepID=UPI00290F7EE8|nr:zinc ABC transporter substrate-binding protein [Rhodophyticola sp. MJ-SS7]MDU8946629.1 zinc ABC transporter substrate-binding protein [Rhodophyticola sp. MJ-SS7]
MRQLGFACLVSTVLALPAWAEAPRVITDIPITQGLVADVMGERGDVTSLLDAGADPHTAQLRPSRMQALAEADVVIWIGAGLTPWLDDVLHATAHDTPTLELLTDGGVEVLGAAEQAETSGHDHSHDHDHGHAEEQTDTHDDGHDHAHAGDPHGWLDPDIAVSWLYAIGAALADADPEGADHYRANARAAAARYEALHQDLTGDLAAVGGREIVVFHDAYSHFARAFGVTVAGSIALGDAADPGARRLAELRHLVEDRDVACVFREPQHSPAAAEALADDAGIGIGTLDPLGVDQAPGAGHYEAMMRALAASILDCVTDASG